MTSAVKRSVIGFCVAFGNMFLAHELFFLLTHLFNDALSLLFYVLQLILNIVLYFAVLKKRFEPVKERNPLFYFLLAVTAGAVWTGAFFIFITLARFDIIELNVREANYPEMLLGFLPMFLIFTIAFSVIYYTFFRKHVGELFHFYTISILLIITIPLVMFLVIPGT
ncbi:MAG: hypothetical protein OSJ43_08350 [Oscillospiraceae bacterium]|nr:hypothetical protein [Oscillospiraceae bacterium]